MGALTIDAMIGPIEIGAVISIFLFGLSTLQTFIYFQSYPNDSWKIKLLVTVTWLLELGHSILTSYGLYFMTVTNYGNPNILKRTPDSVSIAIIFAALISPVIQAFFAHRVRTISGRWTIAVICWVLLFLRFVALIGVLVTSYTMTSLVQFTSQWRWLLASALAISAVVDALIAGSLCYYFWQRRDSVHKSTSKVLDHLIAWTLQTGLLTSLATTCMLIFFCTLENYAWLAMFFIIPKLFSNSLLASLNARESLRKMSQMPTADNGTRQFFQSTGFTPSIGFKRCKERDTIPGSILGIQTQADIERGGDSEVSSEGSVRGVGSRCRPEHRECGQNLTKPKE